MSIKIRKASAEDASFLATMILQSTRAGKKLGLFDVIFDAKNDEELLQSIAKLTKTDAKNHCHYSNFLIAQLDEEDVGSLCSYEPRIATKQTFIDALNEVGCSADVSQRLEVFYDCTFESNTRTLMFDFMEELEGFIDVGVLKELMQKSLLNARLKGYRIAQAIVEMGSLDTEMYYKKLGFKRTAQKECESYKEVFGRPGLVLFSIEF